MNIQQDSSVEAKMYHSKSITTVKTYDTSVHNEKKEDKQEKEQSSQEHAEAKKEIDQDRVVKMERDRGEEYKSPSPARNKYKEILSEASPRPAPPSSSSSFSSSSVSAPDHRAVSHKCDVPSPLKPVDSAAFSSS